MFDSARWRGLTSREFDICVMIIHIIIGTKIICKMISCSYSIIQTLTLYTHPNSKNSFCFNNIVEYSAFCMKYCVKALVTIMNIVKSFYEIPSTKFIAPI